MAAFVCDILGSQGSAALLGFVVQSILWLHGARLAVFPARVDKLFGEVRERVGEQWTAEAATDAPMDAKVRRTSLLWERLV